MTQSPETPNRSRKDVIIEVATTLFAERGYEGTSMNDVAERAGMRKASLFYHFASKETLYEAVLDHLLANIAGPITEAFTKDGSFPERLDAAADVTTMVLSSNPYAARLLLREVMDWGPAVRGKLLTGILAVMEGSAAFIRDGQQAGAFVEADAKQVILTMLGAHVVPFAIGNLVERYMGCQPFDATFVEARRKAMLLHMRQLMARPPSS
jgi:AcrR family transcriptional regulator